jgi:hypothetical protein
MVAGAVAAFSVVRTALLAFSVPVLTPLIIRFFSLGDEIHVAMGGMTLLFAVLIHVMAFRVNSAAVLSLKHRYENVSLVAYLAAANERAEELNAQLMAEITERKKAQGELQRHRDNLEELVKKFGALPESRVVICMGEGAKLGWDLAFAENPAHAGWRPVASAQRGVIALCCPHPSWFNISGAHASRLLDGFNPEARILKTLQQVRQILDAEHVSDDV